MVISCRCFHARGHRGLGGRLGAPQRPARSLGPQRSGGWRAERSCCLARNAAAWRQGEKIANEPLRAKRPASAASLLWRVIRQQKDDMDVGPKRAHRRALAQRNPALRSIAIPRSAASAMHRRPDLSALRQTQKAPPLKIGVSQRVQAQFFRAGRATLERHKSR